MSAEPDPTVNPTSLPMSPLRSKASTALSLDHSWRQKLHRSIPVATFKAISVAPQRSHLARPSLAPPSVLITWGAASAAGSGTGSTTDPTSEGRVASLFGSTALIGYP